MTMKTHKRMIALFVTLAFLSLLHATTMPLRADQAPGPSGTAVSADEQGPGFIEEEGYGSAPAKKSIIPVILIGLGVAVLAAVLVLVVFKTKYDIVGTWSLDNSIWSLGATTLVFSGDKKSGTITLEKFIDTGTYTVDGKSVHFEFKAAGYNYNWVHDGQFDGKDRISGTVQYYVNNNVSATGTFTATRVASAAASGGSAMGGQVALELK
jgi:aspartate oxidase